MGGPTVHSLQLVKQVPVPNITEGSLESFKRGIGSLGKLLDEIAGGVPRSHGHLDQLLLHTQGHAEVVEDVAVPWSSVEFFGEEFSAGVAEVSQMVDGARGMSRQSVWTSCGDRHRGGDDI